MKRFVINGIIFILVLFSVSFLLPSVQAADLPQATTPELYQLILQKMYAEQYMKGASASALTEDQIYAIASAAAAASVLPKIGSITKTQNTYVAVTGTTGLVRGTLPVGRYAVDITPLENFRFTLSDANIIIDQTSGVYFGIGIQEAKGKGKVAIAKQRQWSVELVENSVSNMLFTGWKWMRLHVLKSYTPSIVSTGSVFDTNTLIMQLFNDKNGNGKPDAGEKPVEWANLKIRLTKVSTEQRVAVPKGISTLYFDSLPTNITTVQELANRIYVATGGACSVTFTSQGKTKTASNTTGTPVGVSDALLLGIRYQIQATYPGSFVLIY